MARLQTASIHWRVWHVGKLKAKCLVEKTCPPVEAHALSKMGAGAHATNKHEMAKQVPQRFPYNGDEIGIEIVGASIGTCAEPPYEAMTPAQNAALHWLVTELEGNLKVPSTEVFRHPTVSRKDRHEAETAIW